MKTLKACLAVAFLLLVGVGLASEESARVSLRDAVRLNCVGCFTNFAPFSGDLTPDDSATLTFTVGSAREYTLIGACDNECGDLDLELYAPGGKLVAKHRGRSITPTLRAYLRPGVKYELDVNLSSCADAVCSYAVGIYRRR